MTTRNERVGTKTTKTISLKSVWKRLSFNIFKERFEGKIRRVPEIRGIYRKIFRIELVFVRRNNKTNTIVFREKKWCRRQSFFVEEGQVPCDMNIPRNESLVEVQKEASVDIFPFLA